MKKWKEYGESKKRESDEKFYVKRKRGQILCEEKERLKERGLDFQPGC